jgi:hypothetical protein
VRVDKLRIYARAALTERSESDLYQQNYIGKWEDVPSTMDYKRGGRTRGGVDGYRYHEGALKTLAPCINSLKKRVKCIQVQDGGPAHRSRIAHDLTVEKVRGLLCPGHSPEINASQHAWPRI